ncbi:MAG: hypothetical protein FGM52_12030, partial [Mycobacterium sp.]|nr:hypothetical protein [Mycobacterium sp.]
MRSTALRGDAVDRQWLVDLLSEITDDTEQPAPPRTGLEIYCTGKRPSAANPGNSACRNQVAADKLDLNHVFLLVEHAVESNTEGQTDRADWVRAFADIATVDSQSNRIYLTMLGIRNALAYIN